MGGLWAETAGLGLKGIGEKERRLLFLLVIVRTDFTLSLAFRSAEVLLSLSLSMKRSGTSTGEFIFSTFLIIFLELSLILKP